MNKGPYRDSVKPVTFKKKNYSILEKIWLCFLSCLFMKKSRIISYYSTKDATIATIETRIGKEVVSQLKVFLSDAFWVRCDNFHLLTGYRLNLLWAEHDRYENQLRADSMRKKYEKIVGQV